MEEIRMRRHAVVGLAVVFMVVVVACSDVPAPTSKGNRAVGVEQEEAAEGKPPPKTQAGVVPKLVGVTVGDSKKAIVAAGFVTGTIDTLGLFGTPANNWIVCEQSPVGGQEPGEGAEINLTADRSC
jgi:hypothetical protein